MTTVDVKKRKNARIKRPVKQNINFAHLGERPIKWGIVGPAALIIVILLAVFVKVAVVDRYLELNAIKSRAEREENLQKELYAQIDSYAAMSAEYAHYSYDGFTEDEISYVDRKLIFDLIEKNVMKKAEVASWSLNGNILVMNLSETSLYDIAELSKNLKSEDIVDYCMVSTAQTYSGSTDEGQKINAVLTVYLHKEDEYADEIMEEVTK